MLQTDIKLKFLLAISKDRITLFLETPKKCNFNLSWKTPEKYCALLYRLKSNEYQEAVFSKYSRVLYFNIILEISRKLHVFL